MAFLKVLKDNDVVMSPLDSKQTSNERDVVVFADALQNQNRH
jgi:hypothetical protein